VAYLITMLPLLTVNRRTPISRRLPLRLTEMGPGSSRAHPVQVKWRF
jgi:hypothetical protein